MRMMFDERPGIKELAYGVGRRTYNPNRQGQLFRVERGHPYERSGKLVVATPQFKTETIYSPTNTNVQLPTKAVTPVLINRGRLYSAEQL